MQSKNSTRRGAVSRWPFSNSANRKSSFCLSRSFGRDYYKVSADHFIDKKDK